MIRDIVPQISEAKLIGCWHEQAVASHQVLDGEMQLSSSTQESRFGPGTEKLT